MAEEQQNSLVGQEISGCTILQKVAVGGMGAIYKARHKALDRIVCVKILSPSLTNDKKAVELFLTEARAIAELEHPNIVQVYNVGKEKGYYFIVMAFVEGQTLSQLVKRNKKLDINTVLDLFEGVLLGLDAAHAKGIIHRDIKPSNILINPQMQAKIVDFGIAKKMDKDKGSTKTTELAGTAYFIAPEQALGRDLDTRADLYSVGASLYYVLTGQFPYNGKNTIDIIQKHINEPVPNAGDLRPDLPAWLSGAIAKLMSKKPEDRFQTAKETYVYFQKMRAVDLLNVKHGSTINLGENSGLKLVKEEKFNTSDIRKARQVEKEIKQTAPTKPSMLPSVEAAKVLPNATAPKEAKAEVNAPQLGLLNAQSAKTVEVYNNQAPTFAQRQIQEKTRETVKLAVNTLIKLPVFILFTFFVAYVCHRLGVICSVHTDPTQTLLTNLISPFVASQYAEHQLLFTLIVAITLVLIFVSASVKEYARASLTLFCLAFVSYMAGLFVPTQAFLDMHAVLQNLFSPAYYFGYLILALLWAISFCFTYNRTVMQGLLASALVALTLVLSYLTPNLSIAPASHVPLFKILFFGALFCAVAAGYYLLDRKERTTVIAPLVFLLVSCGFMWTYTVSGAAQTTRTTLQALTHFIHPQSLTGKTQNEEIEKLLGIESRREVFAKLDKTTDISILDDEQSKEFFTKELNKIAPNAFTAENAPLFIHLLTDYYNGGENKMKATLWSYVLSLPIEHFNQNAQENSAYTFMMMTLMLLSICFCLGSLFLSEE